MISCAGWEFEFLKTNAADGEQGALRMTWNGISRLWSLPSFPLKNGMTRIGKPEGSGEESDGYDGRKDLTLSFSFVNSPAILSVRIQVWEECPICRIRYTLKGADAFCGRDNEQPVCYGSLSIKSRRLTELQISQFDRICHSYVPAVTVCDEGTFEDREFPGPVLVPEDAQGAVLAAYEHGAQAPDHFLAWLADRNVLSLQSVKGNYYGGQPVDEYAAPWIVIGFSADRDTLFREYRSFLLNRMGMPGDSRKPYIFYNTWHMQEANTYFHGDSYLRYLKEDVILKDIEIAHRIGVEVYVIDAGWFGKTGDWRVNEDFFPEKMASVRRRLEQYGMRLGLWFNPIAAAKTSSVYLEHPEYVMSREGKEVWWGKIWDTEESCGMCLASGYGDWFIEELVRLNRELGVTYFKWDGIDQYGCDSPCHDHGNEQNSPSEREDAYAYRMGLEMIRIAGEVNRRCPGAIVDFDVTEGGRFMGLGFLSVGKYFLMNNGPYFYNLDIPDTVRMEPDTINVFFYPGAARPQICRTGTRFDPYIPSVLFLTHFFPHGERISRCNSMASLALGGNGIWGFLQEMDEDAIGEWALFIRKYKAVREDVTRAVPVVTGVRGGSPEICEKLDPKTGRGLVAVFTHGGGEFVHVTQPLDRLPSCVDGADRAEILEGGRVRVTVRLEDDGARVIWFTDH